MIHSNIIIDQAFGLHKKISGFNDMIFHKSAVSSPIDLSFCLIVCNGGLAFFTKRHRRSEELNIRLLGIEKDNVVFMVLLIVIMDVYETKNDLPREEFWWNIGLYQLLINRVEKFAPLRREVSNRSA